MTNHSPSDSTRGLSGFCDSLAPGSAVRNASMKVKVALVACCAAFKLINLKDHLLKWLRNRLLVVGQCRGAPAHLGYSPPLRL